MQQMQEMRTYGIIIGFDFDAFAVMRVVIPVKQHGRKRSHESVCDIASTRLVMIIFFGQHTT